PVNWRAASVVFDDIVRHPVGDCDDGAIGSITIQTFFEIAGEEVEDALSRRQAAGELRQRSPPGLVAYMASDDVASRAAETLTMHHVKTAAHLKDRRSGEAEDGGQSIGSDGRNLMEGDPAFAFALEAVGENMHFVLLAEARGQLGDIPALAAKAMII